MLGLGLLALQSSWYLPFFVTRTAKPRVVRDVAATVDGASLNRAVLAEKTF